jgi:hypothetical protein
MRTPLAAVAAGLLAISLQAGSGVAQTAIERQRVVFPAGADSSLVKGQLKGDQTVDYVLRAGAGQAMTVELKGSNLQNYLRAPRIISKSQRFCRHEEAAKEAAEKENAISKIDKIA